MIITNGLKVTVHEKRGAAYQELVAIPFYLQMLQRDKRKLQLLAPEPIYSRLCYKPLRKQLVNHLIDNGYLGQETAPSLHPFLVNLLGLLHDEQHLLGRYTRRGFSRIEDKGLRFTSFGNASGGTWTGYFRYFLVNHQEEDHILSLNILAKAKSMVQPKVGISTSETMLSVAVDNL